MSQEEEKLIEEFWEDYRNSNELSAHFEDYRNSNELSAHFEDYSREVVCYDFKDRINKSLIKAFRSGKLMGFEMCWNLIPQTKEIFYDMTPKDQLCRIGFNEAIIQILIPIRSLIEEEKKKL